MPGQDGTVLDLVAAQVAARPEAAAVVDATGTTTYGALWERSARVGEEVRAAGGAGRPVGLAAARGRDLVVALLALFRAGAVCVPLDTDYPADQLAAMCADAEVGLALGHPDRLAALGFAPAPGAGPLRLGGRGSGPRTPDRCYIAFTSGSTGRPKAVGYHHAGLANVVRWQVEDSRCGLGDPTVQLAPISFDVAYQEVFATLGAGGTLVCAPDEARYDPDVLWDLVTEHRVARLFVTYVTLQTLALAVPDRPTDHLREIVVAGEQLACTGPIRQLFARLPGCRLANQWGTVEVFIATSHPLPADPAGWPLLPPIGTAVPGLHVHACDDAGRPLPAGRPGELWVAGVGVAAGYLGRPAETAAAFGPDPCGSGVPAYRTGDLGRVAADGTVHYLGRQDDQVKIRGHRVEPAEVEAVLIAIPGVTEAAVWAAGDGPEDRHLEAAVVLTRGRTAADVLRAARDRLPPHLVPARARLVETLPRTPSGKLDRRALARGG